MTQDNNPAGLPTLLTEFVQITVELQTSGVALRDQIETQLQAYGAPLRWAITSVDVTTVNVEAVVTVIA